MHLLKKLLLILSLVCITNEVTAQVNYNFGEFGEAIRVNDFEKVKTMLENGTNPNQMQNVTTPLGIATSRSRDEIFDLLMEQKGIELNTVFTIEFLGAGYENAVFKTALLCAIDAKNIRMANILLDRGAEADFMYSDKHTDGTNTTGTILTNALRLPVSEESIALAQRVADKTTNVNRRFNYLHTPEVSLLYRLIEEVQCVEYNSVVKSIIDRGANIKEFFDPSSEGLEVFKKFATAAEVAAYEKNAKYTYNSCPMQAARRGNYELLDYMLSKGGSMERYNDKGAMLMLSCTNAECVEVLMKYGVDINVQHPVSGWPLIFTAASLDNDLLEGILKLGADPNIEVNGLRTMDVIQGTSSKNKKRVTKILQAYGYNM